VTLKLNMAGPQPQAVTIEARLTSSDGREVKSERIEGTTPIERAVPVTLNEVGYYTLSATARTPGGTFEDRFGVSVVSPQKGMEAVKREWAR
jgi:hypothetical protein